MTTDREWDIVMMEIAADNEALIEEFLMSKMRPRDLEQLFSQEAESVPESALLEEANAV